MLLGFITSGVYAAKEKTKADKDFEKFAAMVYKEDEFDPIKAKTFDVRMNAHAARIAYFIVLETKGLSKDNKKKYDTTMKKIQEDFRGFKGDLDDSFYQTKIEGTDKPDKTKEPEKMGEFLATVLVRIPDKPIKPETDHATVNEILTKKHTDIENLVKAKKTTEEAGKRAKLEGYIKLYTFIGRVPRFEKNKEGKVHDSFKNEIMGAGKIFKTLARDETIKKYLPKIEYEFFFDEIGWLKRFKMHTMKYKWWYGAGIGSAAALGALAGITYTFRHRIFYKWFGMTVPENIIKVEAVQLGAAIEEDQDQGEEYKEELVNKWGQKNADKIIAAYEAEIAV
jgi:hypothetical protein